MILVQMKKTNAILTAWVGEQILIDDCHTDKEQKMVKIFVIYSEDLHTHTIIAVKTLAISQTPAMAMT